MMLYKNYLRFLGVAFAALFFPGAAMAQTGNLSWGTAQHAGMTIIQADQFHSALKTVHPGIGQYDHLAGQWLRIRVPCETPCSHPTHTIWQINFVGSTICSSTNRDRYGLCYPSDDPEDCVKGFEVETGLFCGNGSEVDRFGYDKDGYEDADTSNCKYVSHTYTITESCPNTDPNWRDREGYDINGFDDDDLDRGGKTFAEGGGYGGPAGTGGTPPAQWVSPTPPDHQNGDNSNSNGQLFCANAYPITLLKSTVPGAVLDGLAGCANECDYQPVNTYWDFDTAQEVTMMAATGEPCSGGPNLTGLDITTYTAPTTTPPPDLSYLNHCYLAQGFFYCQSPSQSQQYCFRDNGGALGQSVSCSQSQVNPNTVCGTSNGIYMCIPPDLGCQSFFGEIHCLDTSGNYVNPTSPDHVVNGGNGNGNPADDVFADDDDVVTNGTTVQEQQLSRLNARGLAQEIGLNLETQFDGLGDRVEQGLGELTDAINSPASVPDYEATADDVTGFITGALQGAGDGDSDLSYDGGFLDGLSFVGDLFPSPAACQVIEYVMLADYNLAFTIDTCELTWLIALMEWFLYGSTIIVIYYIVIGRRTEA